MARAPKEWKMVAWKVIIMIGNVLLILAWPIGYYVGLQFAKSSDAAGRGYAQIGGIVTALLVTYLPVTMVFIVVGIKYWSQLKGCYKFLLFSPTWIVLAFILIAGATAIYIALD
jgi:hypothetical protein